MNLHEFLHRTCVIIPLSNGVTVCGTRGPRAHCAGYCQHMVLYTIVNIAFNMDRKISEQRVYCKIRTHLGFPVTEIHADLQKVYGNGALKYATVCKWICHFNDGWESIENDPRTEKNVATVKTLIEEDARDRRIKWHSFIKCFEDLT